MLGHRGCRLSVTYPELIVMQTTAIIEAACNVEKKRKLKVTPEIMVPLVGSKTELDFLRADHPRDRGRHHQGTRKSKVTYTVGTMIEVPRAALTADEIAETAQFFSFGTNDLTQMTFGFSRDDIGSFLPDYLEKKILPVDPFQQLDQAGVGQLVSMAVQKGRQTNPGSSAASAANTAATRQRQVLLQGRTGLRELLPLPRADRAPWRRPRRPSRPDPDAGLDQVIRGGARANAPPLFCQAREDEERP
jgi:phosphoenolpyruvate synthase/pyruvate phosphate dikinase